MYTEDPEKFMLLASMQKLIKYVQTSKQNCWEIFESLSKQDIQKIINNFSDPNHKLRKWSLTLLGILLNDNNPLKERLCERIQTSSIPGKICLNFGVFQKFSFSQEKLKSLIDLLKSPVKKQGTFFFQKDQMFPIWMISLRKEPLKVDFIPMMALSYIDPLDNLVGFTLAQQQKESPKKLFFDIFESITKPSDKFDKKPIFTVAPKTSRGYSPVTQKSQRFTRTSNPKTSLKQNSLKSSMIGQSEEKYRTFENPKYISQSQGFKTEGGSPRKEMFSSKTAHENSINKLQEIHNRIREQLSTAPTNEQKNMSNQSVVNNTHIYINAPVNSISISYKNAENDNNKNQVFFRNEYPQTCKNYGESVVNFGDSVNFGGKGTFPEVSYVGYPMRKYERVTKKLFDLPPQSRNFDFDQYRNFVNKVSISSKLTQIVHERKE